MIKDDAVEVFIQDLLDGIRDYSIRIIEISIENETCYSVNGDDIKKYEFTGVRRLKIDYHDKRTVQ